MAENISTVGPGRDYATLALWEASLSSVASGDQEVAECYGGADLGPVTISGITLADATAYLIIRPASGQRHQGVYNETYARGSTHGINGAIKTSGVSNTRVIGMQFDNDLLADSWSRFLDPAAGDNLYVQECIFHMRGSEYTAGWQQQMGIHGGVDRNSGVVEVRNSIFMDFAIDHASGGPSQIAYMQAAAGDGTPLIRLLNCTFVGVDYVGQYGTRILVRNCIAANPSGKVTNMFNGTSWHTDSDYNTSEDASTPGGTNDTASASVSFVNEGANNFALSAQIAGEDLSSVYGYSNDILNLFPRIAPWSQGAFEYTGGGGGGGTVPIFTYHYRQQGA